MTRITKTNFKKAAKNSGGNQSRIAEKLEVTRSAVNQFIKRHPKLRDIINDEKEFVLDIAEDCIDTDILIRKDVDSAKWKLLNTKRGRARGYGHKMETEHSGSVQNVIFQEIIKSNEEIKEMKNGKTNNSK